MPFGACKHFFGYRRSLFKYYFSVFNNVLFKSFSLLHYYCVAADYFARWEHDEFGRFVKRYMVEDKTEITPPAGEDAPIEPLHDPQVIEENGKWYRLTPRYVDYETPSWDYKPNPDYDASQPYIERRDRKEWDAVGMLGVLSVWDDGTCQVDGWCRPVCI